MLTLTLAAGACIPLGGAIAKYSGLQPNWVGEEVRHFVIALGGGVMSGAVILVLIPKGTAAMEGSFWGIATFLLGGFMFFVLERHLGLRRKDSPQLMGLLLDFIPESIALGGLIAFNGKSAFLLALLIGFQNIPEGFNAYKEFEAKQKTKILRMMCLLTIIGPIAGFAGYFWLSGSPFSLGFIMMFASGGILYLIFQDIAPQSRLENHWAPPLGAIIGVSISLIGEHLIS